MPVAIIGMHRSGTSMLSRMLNICGLDLGAEADMIPAQETNPRGHWEHARIVDINKRILAHFGGTAEDPPVLPERWFERPELQPLYQEASAFVAETFGQATAWGWKDPRTTLTAPFWRRIVPGLRFVVCVRNPLDAASSMVARNHITTRHGMGLWQHYTEEALRNTRPEERIVTLYEDYFPNYRQALAPVLAFLGMPSVAQGSPQDDALREYVDAGLKHYSHTLDDVLQSPETFTVTKLLYDGLLHQPDATQAIVAFPAFEEHTLRAWGGSQQEVVRAQAAQIGQWAKEYAELKSWADQQDATIAELRAWAAAQATAMQEQAATIQAQAAQIAQQATEYEKLHAWADQQATTIQTQAAQVAQQATAYEELRAWADQQTATTEEQAAQNAQQAEAYEQLRTWADTQAATIQQQAARIAELEQEIARLTEWTGKQADVIRSLNARIAQMEKDRPAQAPLWRRGS